MNCYQDPKKLHYIGIAVLEVAGPALLTAAFLRHEKSCSLQVLVATKIVMNRCCRTLAGACSKDHRRGTCDCIADEQSCYLRCQSFEHTTEIDAPLCRMQVQRLVRR